MVRPPYKAIYAFPVLAAAAMWPITVLASGAVGGVLEVLFGPALLISTVIMWSDGFLDSVEAFLAALFAILLLLAGLPRVGALRPLGAGLTLALDSAIVAVLLLITLRVILRDRRERHIHPGSSA